MGYWTYQCTCPICNQEFEAQRSDAVYCSANCRKTASRRPQKIERMAEQARQYIQALAREAQAHPDLADLVAAKMNEIAAVVTPATVTDETSSTNV